MQAYEKIGEKEQLLREQQANLLREEMQKEQEKMRRFMVSDAQKQAMDARNRQIQEQKRLDMLKDQESIQNSLL